MEVLYLDEHIVVCVKPAGVVCEEQGVRSLPCMLSREMEKIGEKNTDIFPIHRLDRDTVGVMVFARTSPAAAAMSKQICEGGLQKTYYAIVHGVPKHEKARLCDLLYYDRGRGKSFVVNRERAGVKRAELEYTVVEVQSSLALLKIQLYTGRTHQIRVQLANRAHPILGDRRYGAPRAEGAGLALVAKCLSFEHPASHKPMCFECDVPRVGAWLQFSQI